MSTLPSTPNFLSMLQGSNGNDGGYAPNVSPGLPSGQSPMNSSMFSGGNSQQPSFQSFMSSPAGQGMMGMFGNGLASAGQSAQLSADRKTQNAQFQQQQSQNQYNADRNFNQGQANTAAAMDPLGASQNYAQHNALLASILPQLQNAHTVAGNQAINNAMPTSRGGLMSALPQGGLDPQMIQRMFGDQTTLNSLAQRQQALTAVNPNRTVANFGSMYGDQAQPFQQQMNQYQNMQQQDAQTRAQAQQKANTMYQQQADQSANRSGIWGKLGKIGLGVGVGALGAMTMGAALPALTPLMGGIIGGGNAAMSTMGNG